jgi:tetratricopeptide (TPR) repeat protein
MILVRCRRQVARLAKKGVVVLAALTLSLGLARSASASPAFDAANRAFAAGHYADAATQYRALIDREGYSAPALFNLGNAYLRDDQPVLAMLAYERAELLAPRDAAIAKNLAEARHAAGVTSEQGLAQRFAHALTSTEWTWLGTAAFWLMLVAGVGAWLFAQPRAWLVRAASAGALVAVVSTAALSVARRDLRTALALKAAPALVSPFDGAQSGFSLPAGADVQLQRAHGEFVLVRDRGGRSGWVERSAVAPLVADGASLGG